MRNKNSFRRSSRFSKLDRNEEMNEISAEQLRELKMMFDYFDTDNSGALDPNVREGHNQELGQLISMIMGGEAT